MTEKIRVAIVYGGRSAEHEVSVVSARCVMEAIDPAKYDVVPVAITKEGRWLLPERKPAQLTAPAGSLPFVEEAGTTVALRPSAGLVSDSADGSVDGLGAVDVVFPLVHGPFGEDGTLQGMLEMAGVPYVGAGVLASALGMDKEMQKRLFAARGLPLAPWIHVHAADARRNEQGCTDTAVDQIGLPCFTKPARLGSSVGVSRCRDAGEVRAGLAHAFEYDEKAIVEKAIVGRELECAVLGNDDPEASVVGEIVSANEFYDYRAKYLEEQSRTIVPADVAEPVAERVRRFALEAFQAIECRGMARVDFFYEEATGAVFLNEINTIPGFTPISMYPKLWDASGIPYAKLVDRLIELALEHR
ncbi:MAG TPA: D-alanine--D-alanine ligase family protein [Actinomycetota bacterium]